MESLQFIDLEVCLGTQSANVYYQKNEVNCEEDEEGYHFHGV